MASTFEKKNENKAYLVFLVCLFSLALFSQVKLYQYGFDDAYIHFRVARNFVETGAPYFNPGEAVKSKHLFRLDCFPHHNLRSFTLVEHDQLASTHG